MMRHRTRTAARAFILSVATWLLLSVFFMPLGLAEDEDEDEDGPTTTTTSTTTTSTTTTTTTTVPATTTTSTTTTTVAPTTTTTTLDTTGTTAPTTTTTPTTTVTTEATNGSVPPIPPVTSTTIEPSESQATPGDSSSTSTVLISPTTTATQLDHEAVDYEATDKEALVISLTDDDDPEGPGSGTGGGFAHIDPREGLSVALHSAVETIQGQLLQAVVLGTLVAALAVIGIDRQERGETKPDPA